MTMRVRSVQSSTTVTVRVPMAFRQRGGRKLVVAPAGQESWAAPRLRVENSLVKALARAFRYKRLLDSGEYTSITELARAEKLARSYFCRLLRLTLLAPNIVEAILDGRQPPDMKIEDLLRPLPVEWEGQRTTVMPDSQDQVQL